jgi:prepilin signal peptidase PulO-like enzyme (type II secretory pathway)
MTLHVVAETFLWLLGLSIGSFLNVVIYRLPAGLSIGSPARSFCPRCEASIAWYDNLPLLSWLLLGGRCRHCHNPISVQYPIVEAVTGLAFVLAYHLLFVLEARLGVAAPMLPGDVPLLLLWLVLVAGMVACAAMDIVSYTVDVRVTYTVLIVGVVLHAVWPRADYLLSIGATVGGAASAASFVVSGVVLWWTTWGRDDEEDEEDEVDEAPPRPEIAPQGRATLERVAGRLAVVVCVGLAVWLAVTGFVPALSTAAPTAALLALVALFVIVVLVGSQQRAADDEIREAIEEEQPQARRMALRELVWLTPMIVAGVVVAALLATMPAVLAWWQSLVAWQPQPGWTPLAGVVYAVHGAIVAAAAGWILRIGFTLGLAREAFGVGDVYILAAAGAAVGWDVALVGLLLSAGIALAGCIVGLVLKRSVMIPFGPWLGLGFLLALLWSRPAGEIAARLADNVVFAWGHRPDLIVMIAGVILVGTGAALALARLLRQLVERE